MVTENEKALLYEIIDVLTLSIKLNDAIVINLGVTGESCFESKCRDAVAKGYKIINGHADD